MVQCNNDCIRATPLAPLCALMKLHLNTTDNAYVITGHGDDYVQINQTRYESPVIVAADSLIAPWRVGALAALTPADFAAVLALKPELVVFGSGARFSFPPALVRAEFARAKIGFEVMDTPAACRTYSVLVSEGRRVVAALLVSAG